MKEQERTGLVQPIDITPNAEQIISPRLAEAIKKEGGVRLEGKEFDEQDVTMMQKEVFAMQEIIDAHRRNPYHNAEHGRASSDRFELLLPALDLKPWQVAAARLIPPFHDYNHFGRALPPSENDSTNISVAALAADEFVESRGFSLSQRVLIQGGIVGSMYNVPEVAPRTPIEKGFALADIAGFSKPWEDWIIESSKVLEEKPEEKRPDSVEAWLQEQLRFLDYAMVRLKDFKDATRNHEAVRKVMADWTSAHDNQKRSVETLLANIDNQSHNRRTIIDGPKGVIAPLLRRS